MPDLPATDGLRRVVIERVRPSVDDGRFAIKRTVGQEVAVSADVFADGHDVVSVVLRVRKPPESSWRELAMQNDLNDGWTAQFDVDEIGRYEFSICGWVDLFGTWYRDMLKRIESGQDIAVDLRAGAPLLEAAIAAAQGEDAKRLRHWQTVLAAGNVAEFTEQGREELAALAARYPDRSLATTSKEYAVVVDGERARYSTWYELFPRSCSDKPDAHGTFADCQRWLARLARMGFDVVYLPPIHPIGTTFRKGKNNAISSGSDDVGSPWAIGAGEGGHKAIHRELGTLDEFRQLISAAGALGIDVALDIAFQCSPDHPYVREHPQWFKKRPDGTIQYAENPPKKYQDIYPFDFASPDWPALWRELTDVVLHWCRQGVRIFRVDNPHTKPFAFWEYLIGEVKGHYPETIFLSEAFTRPKIMRRLAKLGFTQSYTYFTWRNSKAELTEYFTELTHGEQTEYFRPNLWPNTPDILPEHLQTGGRAAFVTRLVMAATLGANYGIYGPAFETMQSRPREAGSEEYWESEKYQLRQWDFSSEGDLEPLLTVVNRARRENPALQFDSGLAFHPTDNDNLLCYSKRSPDGSNLVIVVVNLNFHEAQHGFVTLPLTELGIRADGPFEVRDLLGAGTFKWDGPRNFVELDPHKNTAHILQVRG